MIAIARFNVPMSESASFRAEIELARDVLAQKAKADERFARRFAKIVEKHDKNAYGE